LENLQKANTLIDHQARIDLKMGPLLRITWNISLSANGINDMSELYGEE